MFTRKLIDWERKGNFKKERFLILSQSPLITTYLNKTQHHILVYKYTVLFFIKIIFLTRHF